MDAYEESERLRLKRHDKQTLQANEQLEKAIDTMTNDVTTKAGVFGGTVSMVNPDALKAALVDSAARDPRGAAADGSDYMNFSGKRNVYEVGQEKRDVTKDELWLINVGGFKDGMVCWKGGRKMADRMVPMGQPVPVVDTNEYGPFDKDGDGWSQAKALVAKSIDSGQQVYFSISSVSGTSVFASLQKEIVARLTAGQPYWPIVSFDRETFTSQGFKNGKPVITVDGWLNDQQVSEDLPALFDDKDAEIDLEAMYLAAAGPKPLPNTRDGEPQVARRTRRSV